MWANSVNYVQKTLQSKQSPIGRKTVQSSNPAKFYMKGYEWLKMVENG
jgi:hypothetical protein